MTVRLNYFVSEILFRFITRLPVLDPVTITNYTETRLIFSYGEDDLLEPGVFPIDSRTVLRVPDSKSGVSRRTDVKHTRRET